MNGNKLDNVRHESTKTFKTKGREYLEDKITEIEINSNDLKNKRHKLIKKGYQPRSKLLKDENGNLLAYSHSILSK
jgi:hypothetical protein